MPIQHPQRPALRYHGGKWKLAPWIISHFPSHRVYAEAFGGGASVLLRKPRSYAEIYNDLDGEIVNLFRVLRDSGEELCKQIQLTPFARDEFVDSYNWEGNPIERARKTVVRSFMGFGSNSAFQKSGFRSRTSRSYTTPSHDWAMLPDAYRLLVDRLQGVVIENRSALEVFASHDSAQTLHYVDPPYPLSSRADDKHDYRFEMSDDDHREMANVLKSMRGFVVLSGYNCPLYEELFSDWARIDRQAFADGARARIESLWLNNHARDHAPQQILEGCC